jgi:hypothetical protein
MLRVSTLYNKDESHLETKINKHKDTKPRTPQDIWRHFLLDLQNYVYWYSTGNAKNTQP